MSNKLRYYFIIITFILIDFFTKHIAKIYLFNNSITLLDGFIHFELTYNTGLFYGSLSFLSPSILIIINILLLFCIDNYFKNFLVYSNRILHLSRICLLSGGLSNIIDRFLHQKVTDFVFIDFGLFKTNIFNFADLLIFISCLILLYNLLSNSKKRAYKYDRI